MGVAEQRGAAAPVISPGFLYSLLRFVGVRSYSCDMNNQGKLFKISGLVAIAGIALALVLMVAFGGATGGAVAALTAIVVSLLVIAAAAVCVALAAYREYNRKPGSTPLIYSVIAFPLGFLFIFAYLPLRFPPLAMLALLAIATSIPALIIGIVKKLSVKSAPAQAI